MSIKIDDGEAAGRTAMRKAFHHIIPLIGLAYLCAIMDRINVSFAATEMNADLGFSATVYGLGAGLFFLGYALFEIPSNLLLVRFGARAWIARIMITWGLLSAAMMFVQTAEQFYTMRFLLGAAEAGFYPGVIYYLAGWFPPCHRSRAVSRFFIASPLSMMVMGAISGWLLGLDGLGGLRGWEWMFLVQGLPSVVVGLIVLRFLPESPSTAGWLTVAERAWIVAALDEEQRRIGPPTGHNMLVALRNPGVLMFGAIGFLLIAAITTFTLSTPMVLSAATGLDAAHVGYLVSLGGVLGAAAILFIGSYADRHGDRYLLGAGCGLVMATGFATILVAPNPIVAALGYLLFATICNAIPMLISSAWPDVLPARELAVGAAAINTLSQVGAFVTPYAWGAARDATGSFHVGLGGLAAITLAMSALILVLRRQVHGRPLPAASAHA